jgi:hypothetical protein
MTAPVLFAGEGEPCGTCGAPLAADQRYCLACGTRRDGARLPYRDALATDPRVLPATVHPVRTADPYAGVAATGASPTLLTTLAALACVLLAFGVGVLVGGDGGGGSDQPLVVPAAAAAVAPTTTAAATDTTAEASTDTSAKDASSSDDSSSADEESATPKTPKAAPKKLVESSAKAIKGLEQAKTPEQYAEQSAKLPDVVVTGGGK